MKPKEPQAAPNPPESSASLAAKNTGSLSSGALVPVSNADADAASPVVQTPSALFSAGEIVAGRYRVVRFIARGGMGEVFEVEDLEVRSRIALKTLGNDGSGGDAESIDRFRREIQLARKVTHPNACRIFDLGMHRTALGREVRFLTMELLEGETLSARIKRLGRIPPSDALPLVRQMVAALAAAHQEGIIHRDFKSGNVIVATGRAGERAVVTDFGLARLSVEESDATVSGGLIGTPAYMAPEQVQGGAVTAAADIYALGVVIYEMVTGRRPFTGDSALAIALKRLSESPTPPRKLSADLDSHWEAVILRCLERRPADRFARVADVVEGLEGTAVPAAPGRRRRVRRAGVAGLGIVLVAGGVLFSRARQAPFPGGDAVPASGPAVVGAGRRSVAVLALKNLGRPEAAWLSTALSEMLRTELAAGEKVRTIPGETVARMTMELALATSDSLAQDSLSRVRANVGADLVVLGSYLALANGKVRLDLRLQDTAQGEVVATAAEEGTEEELFDLVSKSGARIRQALKIEAVSEAEATAVRAAFPASPQAARLYSEGLAKLRLFDALAARDLLERAIEAEPGHPMAHSALASAWAALGYDAKARAEAQRALELAQGLPREDRLSIEAQLHEITGQWDKAIEIYRGLFVFFPDGLDNGLRLAAAQISAGKGKEALETLATLRKLPAPANSDPRLDLAEASAAKALTDFARQRSVAVEAGRKARAQGARLLLAQARLQEGTAAFNLDDGKAAEAACDEASRIFTEAGDIAGLARTQNIVAGAYLARGDLAGARSRVEESLRSFRRIGDRRGTARQLANLGNVLSQQEEPDEGRKRRNLLDARKLFEEALTISREISDRSGAARDLNNLAVTQLELGDLEGARRTFEEVVSAFHALGESQYEAIALSGLGEVLLKQGRLDAARERLDASLRISRGSDPGLAAESLGFLAEVLAKAGDRDGARKAKEEAAALQKSADQ